MDTTESGRCLRTPCLSLRQVSKSFDGVTALKSVSLDLFPGEILGLVGDNGAGKSTLIKLLAGVHVPDSGRLLINGKEIDRATYNVRSARRLGIETVFQDRSLGEKQPLWRNTFLGRPIANRFGFINVKEQKRVMLHLLQNHIGLRGVGIDADARVRTLSGGERQGLAITRAMYFDSSIVILDEPTTALSLHEVEKVLKFVAEIVERNKACIYISHNVSHVYQVAHRIVMLDRGELVGEYVKKDLSPEELGARLMGIQAGSGVGKA
jgi:simple sugar transport system ATP-binding protein